MNRRVLSSNISLSQISSSSNIYTSNNNNSYLHQQQQQLSELQTKSLQNQISYLKKQNLLLKQQVQQLKVIQCQSRKQLQLYRNIVHKNNKIMNKQQQSHQINEVFQLQHKKIFDLQTQLEILQDKYNKAMNSLGSRKQTEYAIKCKQLEKILQKTEIQYQKEIVYLKKKLMKYNAEEILQSSSISANMKKNKQSEYHNNSLYHTQGSDNTLTKRIPTSPSTELKPIVGANYKKYLT